MMIKKIKEWWFRISHVKCDYCKEPVDYFYDAYAFSIDEYKGDRICLSCIKKLPKKKTTKHSHKKPIKK